MQSAQMLPLWLAGFVVKVCPDPSIKGDERMAKQKNKEKKAEKKDKKAKGESEAQLHSAVAANGAGAEGVAEPPPPMSRKEHDKEIAKLQVELVKLQEWVKVYRGQNLRLFEGAMPPAKAASSSASPSAPARASFA